MNRAFRNQARRHCAVVLIVLAGLLGAAGCVNVPTTGPIRKVEGQQPGCQNCVNVVVAPPAAGDKPTDIVEGYLRATSNYQPNYSVAKQFLSQMAAEKWSPETGVRIYVGTPAATAKSDTVRLSGRLVGELEADRTYVARDTTLKVDFHLVEENGEWRIDNPLPGLMVAEYSFTSFYQPYDLYFVGNGSALVPDHIYLPALSNPANVASALMKALLKGPSRWLKPAVTSAIPPNTSLSVDSVTITDGIAEVPLSDTVLALADPQRSLLAAQIVYTLRQVGGVKGVLIKANQQPYRVLPGSDPTSPTISVDAIPRDIDPVPFVSGDQLYAVDGRAVKRVRTTANTPATEPLEGPLGQGKLSVDALAVSMTNTDLAVTTDRRTTLRRAPITPGEPSTPSTVLSGVTDLLRPQFTRYGEIWVIGRQGGRQRMWMSTEKKPIEVETPVLRDGTVTAFKISPDGTRIALVRATGTGFELGLARIIRSQDKIMVNGWRALNTAQTAMPPIRTIADVAWLDGTELLVLGATYSDSANTPYRVVEDASRITAEGEPQNWDAEELAVLPWTQTAIIIGRTGNTWKDDGSEWLPFLEDVSTIAYPG
ncbi:MAG TPA: LpqB family beta-propeller domain-containing protein [Propionibacteriaceae bacterium]|nr:LpqB family beta-propeller domain-containing protein [Propionibacteriaceae bacterium]